MAGNIVHLTDDNFQDIINGNQTVIIDSWAEWCAPCKAIAPLYEKLAGKYGDKMTFAKLNTDENIGTMRALKIMNIPTFVIFKNGDIVKKWSGADAKRLTSTVEELVKN